MGELLVRGPTSAIMYWNNREQSRATFLGEWTRSGDKYVEDEDGYYVYCGRRDDMLKVSGLYVSPFEVEGALQTHADVLESAVVAWLDGDGLIKPKAFVVLKDATARPATRCRGRLQDHVKAKLAPYKYPRWIEFRTDLPKTATGKIQRFKLRAEGPPARAKAVQPSGPNILDLKSSGRPNEEQTMKNSLIARARHSARSPPGRPWPSRRPIKIGFISTFSGPTAVIGNDMRNSFELALDHHGPQDGRPAGRGDLRGRPVSRKSACRRPRS